MNEHRIIEAAEVAYTCRRLFEEENIVPDPADEDPLKEVELKLEYFIDGKTKEEVISNSVSNSCAGLVAKYLSL